MNAVIEEMCPTEVLDLSSLKVPRPPKHRAPLEFGTLLAEPRLYPKHRAYPKHRS